MDWTNRNSPGDTGLISRNNPATFRYQRYQWSQ